LLVLNNVVKSNHIATRDGNLSDKDKDFCNHICEREFCHMLNVKQESVPSRGAEGIS
jgi:hypothetical protein